MATQNGKSLEEWVLDYEKSQRQCSELMYQRVKDTVA